jgi:hypothetical protein
MWHPSATVLHAALKRYTLPTIKNPAFLAMLYQMFAESFVQRKNYMHIAGALTLGKQGLKCVCLDMIIECKNGGHILVGAYNI